MRKHYLDNVRWFTVVLVVVYHVVLMFCAAVPGLSVGSFSSRQPQDALLYALHPWFMVLLFIVSGMSSAFYLQNHTQKEFIRSRTVKLLIPSTIGLFVFQWLQGYVSIKIAGGFETFGDVPKAVQYLIMCLSGIGVLWYVQTLWILSLVLLLVRAIERGKLSALCARLTADSVPQTVLAFAVVVATGALLWGAAQILNTPVIVVYRFGAYGFAFFAGYFLFSNDRFIDFLARFWIVFLVVAVALGSLFTVRSFGQNYAEKPVVNSLCASAFAWSASLAVLGTFRRFFDRTGRFADFMNRKSWGLYVFHYLPLSFTAYMLMNHTSLPPVLMYLLTLIAAVAGALVLYEIISRIPVVRWCVLGISRKRGSKD